MNRGMLYVSLVLACSCSCTFEYRPWLGYSTSWTCLSSEGCERGEQLALIDRLAIHETYEFYEIWSTRDATYRWLADLLDSDSLPPHCYLMTGVAIFGHELEPLQICPTDASFTMELAIPNRDEQTHSMWRVEARYMGRIANVPL